MALFTLAACDLPWNVPPPAIRIQNTSDAELIVREAGTGDVKLDVTRGYRQDLTFAAPVLPDEPRCVDWLLEAVTDDGLVVATFGPPVCGGDEWTITQEDVDSATD